MNWQSKSNNVLFKHRLFTIFSLIIHLFCISILQAQDFATVDTRILLILHPSMNCYDYKNSAFFRDNNPEKNSTETFKKLKAAQKKADKENEEINKELKNLDKQRFELSNELLREEQVFAPGDLENMKKRKNDLEAVLSEMRKKNVETTDQIRLHNSKIKDIENNIAELDAVLKNPSSITPNKKNIEKYKELIKNIDKRKAELKKQILENNDNAMKALYLTQKETEEKLTKIRNEIKQIIKEVAEKEKCSLVIDNSYAIRDPEREKRKGTADASGERNPARGDPFSLSEFGKADL